MNYLIIGGVAVVAVAGGAFLMTSGSGSSDAAANTTGSNAVVANASSAATSNAGAQNNTAAQNTPSNAPSSATSSGTPKLHPVKNMCIEYVSEGQMMNGTTTSCHRNWAYERYEIVMTEIGIAGMTQTQNQHTIYIGDQIYAINLDTNTGTQTTNPAYDGIVSAMQNSSPEEMSAVFIEAMNFTPNGETKTIAGMSCNGYSAPQLGTACLTPEGVMLEQSFMGNTQRAVSVSFSDSGDNANYTLYQNVPITDGPDLSGGINGLIDQLGGNN